MTGSTSRRPSESRPSESHSSAHRSGSLFGRIVARLGRTEQEEHAAELTEEADALGATRISDVVDRRMAEVSGVIRSLTLPPATKVPTLVADLYDGTGSMALVWLGRREIRGVVPGVRMRVEGRVTFRKGVPTMFNPRYDLLPRHVR